VLEQLAQNDAAAMKNLREDAGRVAKSTYESYLSVAEMLTEKPLQTGKSLFWGTRTN
jgi:hypothetical protein